MVFNKRCLIFVAIFSVLVSQTLNCRAGESESTARIYKLSDLYRIALKQAEKIKLAGGELFIAEKDKDRAFAVLVPRFTAFGDYTKYSEEDDFQPGSVKEYGLRLDQSFTLNGKELIGFRMAKDQIKKKRFDLDSVKENYLFQVASAYFEVLKTMESREIALANLKRLKAHEQAVMTKLEIEAVSKTDLFRTRAELSGAKTDLVKADGYFRLAKTTLARLAGIPLNFTLSNQNKTIQDTEYRELKKIKQNALNRRADLKSLVMDEKIAQSRIKYTKGAFWPAISLEALYSDWRPDPTSFYLYGKSFGYVKLGISMPLYDGGLRNAELSQARRRREMAELAVEDYKKEVGLEVEKASLGLETAESTIDSLEEEVRSAKENYDAVEIQFKHGLADSIDTMDANTLLVKSENELSEARYGKQVAVIGLKRACGTFLKEINEKYGLTTKNN